MPNGQERRPAELRPAPRPAAREPAKPKAKKEEEKRNWPAIIAGVGTAGVIIWLLMRGSIAGPRCDTAHPPVPIGPNTDHPCVSTAKQRLAMCGYATSDLGNTLFDAEMQGAVLRYQQEVMQRPDADGVIDSQTWNALMRDNPCDRLAPGEIVPPPGPCDPGACEGPPYLTLMEGDRGSCVGYLQQLLNQHGARLTVDCIFGSKTCEAVKNFKVANGLEADCVVTPSVWRLLMGEVLPPAPKPGCFPDQCTAEQQQAIADGQLLLRNGDSGPCVGLMQQMLVQCGYQLPRYGIDCKFGSETEQAVRAFQRDKGLQVDGIVGPKTWAALQACGAPPVPGKEGPRSSVSSPVLLNK